MKNKIHSKNFRGFTILELLVVVSVSVMIVSFISVSIVGAKKKSRDAKREEDIKGIQNALSLYAASNRFFPVCAQTVINGSSDCLSLALIADGSATSLTKDPLGGSNGTCNQSGDYVYCYTCSDGLTYTLEYALETDGVSGKSAGWQTVLVEH